MRTSALAMSTARKTPKKTKTATNGLAASTESTERRSGDDRRSTELDRRAFWRPTPDRRREERELGRRTTDRRG